MTAPTKKPRHVTSTRNLEYVRHVLAGKIAHAATRCGLTLNAEQVQRITADVLPLMYRLPYGHRTVSGYEVPDKSQITLTPRGRRVLIGVAQGLTCEQIGAKLFVSMPTVKSCLSEVYRVLGARNAAHAVAIALKYRLLTAEEIADV